jgi:hypothetical protein
LEDSWEEDELESRYWDQWPCCPDCARRRPTECPVCGVSGDAIPLADCWTDELPLRGTRGDALASENSPHLAPVLLVCPCCDEPFRPRFFRYCHACGHDFGDGLQRAGDPEPIGGRAIWTAAGLMIVGLLLLAWFDWVLS